MKEAVEMITTPQIKKVWYEVKKLKLTEEDVHAMIKAEFGVDSLKKLTKSQAIYMIDTIVRYTGNSKHRPGMASPEQLWKIEDLRKKLDWEPNGIKGFIKKYAHVENVNWLTDKAATGIITGLTKVLKAQAKKKSGPGTDSAPMKN